MQKSLQLGHEDHIPCDIRYPLCIIANDLTSPLNVGSLFRLCDALGIERLHLCGDTPAPPNNRISKTSRSTEKYVEYEYHQSADSVLDTLREKGYKIIALEITSSSISIGTEAFHVLVNGSSPICLIIGSENSGVDNTLLSQSDAHIHIPMMGNNSSMNVVSATAIACFEICRNLV